MPTGPFNIPLRPDQSTRGARDAYWRAFGTQWNGGNDTRLRALAQQFDRESMSGFRTRCNDFLIWLREMDDLRTNKGETQ